MRRAGRPVSLALGALCLTTAALAERRIPSQDLIQPLLSGELSVWLLGPISSMASKEEIARYQELTRDEDARAFIEEFWRRRDPTPEQEGNELRTLYRQRVAEADKKFSEAALSGHRTDRGTIYVLYGPPDQVEYEDGLDLREPDIELWKYSKGTEPGLDGERPRRQYRFARIGDLTVFYQKRSSDPSSREVGRPGRPPSSGSFPEPRQR